MTFFTKENTLQFVHAECYENRLADAKATSTPSFFLFVYIFPWTLSVIRLSSFAYSMNAVRIVSLSDWPSLAAILSSTSLCSLLSTTLTMGFFGTSASTPAQSLSGEGSRRLCQAMEPERLRKPPTPWPTEHHHASLQDDQILCVQPS